MTTTWPTCNDPEWTPGGESVWRCRVPVRARRWCVAHARASSPQLRTGAGGVAIARPCAPRAVSFREGLPPACGQSPKRTACPWTRCTSTRWGYRRHVDVAAVCWTALASIGHRAARGRGHGMVRCQHGVIPVPVPAVVNIAAATGLPLSVLPAPGELVTPTGAAIAAAAMTSTLLPALR